MMGVLQSNVLTEQILGRITSPFLALDENCQVTFINHEAAKIIGVSKDALKGRILWDFTSDFIADSFTNVCHESLDQQTYQSIELFYPRLQKWYEHHLYPSKEGLSIYFFDITAKKIENDQIRITKARLDKAEKIGNLGYWELAPGKDTMWGSEQTLRIFGFHSHEGEIPIEKVESLIVELETLKEANHALIVNGIKYEIQLTILPADGSLPRIISVTADIEFDADGNRNKIVGVLKDITEMVNTQQRLLESNSTILGILESMDMSFFLVDPEWNIKSWNQEAEKDFEDHTVLVQNTNLWRRLPKSTENLKEELMSAMTLRKTNRFDSYFPDRQLWMRVSCFPAENGGLAIFFHDITESKRKEHLDLLERDALEYYTNKNASVENLIKFLLDGLRKIHTDMFCSVLRVKDGKLYNWSSPHLPASYNMEVEGLEVGLGKGSCGSASFLRDKVETIDIRNHSFWKDFQDIVRRYPMRSCTSYPIIDSHQNLLGTFGIYFNSVRGLTDAEEQSIERVRKILVNVVEKKLMEDEAKEFQDQLELIFNMSREIIFLVSVEGNERYKILRVNDQYLKAAGKERAEVEGNYLKEIIDEPLLSFVREKYKEACVSGKTISWEHTTPTPHGNLTSNAYISPIMDENNVCKQLIGYVQDTTQQKRADAEIRKANEDLSLANETLLRKNSVLKEIARMQSHTVRAPVARILGLANFLINHASDQKEKELIVRYMLDSVKELDEIIKEIVNLSWQSEKD